MGKSIDNTAIKPKLKLHAKQSIAWQYLTNPKYNDIPDIGFGGAARGGKSYLGAAWIIHMCNKHANTKWFAARAKITDIVATTEPKFFEVLNDLGYVKNVDFEYNVKNRLFKFIESGSEIKLLGLPWDPGDPKCSWMGGYEFTGGWIDEANEVHPAVVSTLIDTRTGTWKNTKEIDGEETMVIPVKVLQTFNPDQNHVFTRFWLPYKNKTQTTSRFIRSYISDNPKYPRGTPYRERLENMPEGVNKDRLLRGSFEYNSSEKAMFDSQAVADMFGDGIKEGMLKVMVVDVSASDTDEDKTICGFFNIVPKDTGWLYDCYDIVELTHKTSEELLSKVLHEKVIHGIISNNIIVDGNGVGNGLSKSAKMKGCIPFIAHSSAIKSKTEGIVTMKKGKNFVGPKLTAVAHRLRDQCVYRLSEKVNRGDVTASFAAGEHRDMLKQELLLYENGSIGTDELVTVTTKKEMRKGIGRSPDISDLFQMVMILELIDKHITRARPKSERKFTKLKKKKRTYV